MSWQAMSYAARLPLTRLPGAGARAVLALLADAADEYGTGAFPSVTTLAQHLDVSARSVKRYLSELRTANLIEPGDPTLVAHLRADRRPQVWDLTEMRPHATVSDITDVDETPAHGVTADDTPHGVTSTDHGGTPVVTPHPDGVPATVQRGDRYGSDGVTAAVPQNHPRTTPEQHAGRPEISTALAALIREQKLARGLPQGPIDERAARLAAAGWDGPALATALDAEDFTQARHAGLLLHTLDKLAAAAPPTLTRAAPTRRCEEHNTPSAAHCSPCWSEVKTGTRRRDDVGRYATTPEGVCA